MSVTTAERNPAAKVLRALSWLVTKGDSHCGVRELATALNLPPSGAHRLLSILAQEGFVRRDPESSTYALGPNLLRLANVSAARSPLGQLAHEPMCDLAGWIIDHTD